MARLTRQGAKQVYEAAQRFADSALRADDSLFTAGRPIWSKAVVEDLYDRYVVHEDLSSGSFSVRLRGQLQDAPPETIQLMGEVLFVHLLVISDINGASKQKTLNEVLSWSPSPVSIPIELERTLDYGLAGFGAAISNRFFHVQFLVEFARNWKDLAEEKRDQILRDPWAFKEFASSVTVKRGGTQREALLHLLFPDTFEYVVSVAAKQQIANSLSDLAGTTEDVDRRLYKIREKLTGQYGPDFQFYDEQVREKWAGSADKWGEFVGWGQRFYSWEGFDESERNFKLLVADSLRNAREALVSVSADWHKLLKKAFGPPTNFIAWQLSDKFLKWCESQPDTARAALSALWNSPEPSAEVVDAFVQQVPASVAGGPGGSTCLAAFLLMVADPRQYPPYLYSIFQKGYALTGYPVPSNSASAGEIYEHARAFLDSLAEKALEHQLKLRDRLDAQAILYSIVRKKGY